MAAILYFVKLTILRTRDVSRSLEVANEIYQVQILVDTTVFRRTCYCHSKFCERMDAIPDVNSSEVIRTDLNYALDILVQAGLLRAQVDYSYGILVTSTDMHRRDFCRDGTLTLM